MSSDSVSVAVDKREVEQFLAGWAGLVVCGLVAAIIWFFAIRTITINGEFEASALDCASSYGVNQQEPCATP